MSLSILVQIDDAGHAGVTGARLAFNAEIPQTVEGPLDEDGVATRVPNPALIATDTDYYLARAGGMVASWAAQHAPAAPPPPPPPPVVAGVPQIVTRRQALQALVLSNKLHLVQPAIDAIPDATQRALMQIEFDDSQSFERQRPSLITMAHAIGLVTDAQIDALFVLAASL